MALCRIAVGIFLAAAISVASVWANEIDEINDDLARIRADIESAEREAASYSGGLVQALVMQRLATLRVSEAMLDQRRIALDTGAEFKFVVNAVGSDPERAAEIMQDLLDTKRKLAEAEAEAAQYSGGLVQALAISTVVTLKQTVAMLEQAALAAHYGLVLPNIVAAADIEGAVGQSSSGALSVGGGHVLEAKPLDCMTIADFGSRTLDINEVFASVAWKVDIRSTCDKSYRVRVRFTLQDAEEFEIDYDTETINVPANGIGKARGEMLVSPASNYQSVEYNGVSLSLVP